MAALERAVADHLKEKGYVVLGGHPKTGPVDSKLWTQVLGVIEDAISPRTMRFSRFRGKLK